MGGSWSLAWLSYMSFCAVMAAVRTEVREAAGIRGNILEDLCLCLVLYPAVALQMDVTTRQDDKWGDAISCTEKEDIAETEGNVAMDLSNNSLRSI